MKKILTVLIICVLMFGLVSCADKKDTDQTTTSTSVSVENNTETTVNKTTEQATNGQENISNDVGGSDILQDKYRVRYYNITTEFAKLADPIEVRAWEEKIYEVSPNETNEMVIKRFVQDFDISREDFDKANHELALSFSQELQEAPMMNPKDYLNQEIYEVYNADIIYTFDDEIINEYYLSGEYPFCYQDEYENAVLSGEYKTQTTDFYFDYDDHSTVKLRGYQYDDEIQSTKFAGIPEETTLPEQTEAVTTE
ncbi:MAG: hypothetical protein IKK63_07670 [Clostridia bacterium]|nr:hypothetical protein [Clostridia bacterium]